MIHTMKSRGLLTYDVVWFPDLADLAAVSALRRPAVLLRQASADFLARYQHRVVLSRRFCTAVVDLSHPSDELLAGMQKTRRARLRKAETLGYEVRVGRLDDCRAGRNLIDGFNRSSFGRPVSAANWQLVEQFGWLSEIRLDGEVLAALAMIADGPRRARVLYGATAGRTGDPARARLVADLNSALLWADMRRCQALGLRSYDLGGLFDDPGHPSSGIDEFKLSFGAHKIDEYHVLTSPYWLARRGLASVVHGL